MKKNENVLRILRDNFLGVIIIVVLQLVLLEVFNTSPETFIKVLWRSLFHSTFDYQPLIIEIGITLRRFFIGFLLALVTAIPFGLIIGRNKIIGKIFEFPIEAMRPIPSAVIIPLLIMLIGIGEEMKYLVVWYGAFWPLLIFTKESSNNIDHVLLETGKMYQLSNREIIKEIVLPATLPNIIAGAKTALSIGLLLAITVEMIAGGQTTGIGYFILDSERRFDYSSFFCGVIVLGTTGYLLNLIFERIERALYKKNYGYLKTVDSENSIINYWFRPIIKKINDRKSKIIVSEPFEERKLHNHKALPYKREVYVNNLLLPGSDMHIAIHHIKKGVKISEKYAISHSHNNDEINILLETNGSNPLRFEIENTDEPIIATAPCSIYIPKNTKHAVNVIDGEGIYICIIKRGNL